jgi:hypothetical protein
VAAPKMVIPRPARKSLVLCGLLSLLLCCLLSATSSPIARRRSRLEGSRRAASMIQLCTSHEWLSMPTGRRRETRCCRTRQSVRGGAPLSASGMTAVRKPPTPDLFSHAPAREPSAPSQNPPSSSLAVAKAVNNLASPRHVLPKNLTAAVRHLTDQELDQLLSAVLDEQKRRRHKPSEQISDKQRIETGSSPLTRGQINAVSAAFKAGVTPTRFARHFIASRFDAGVRGNTAPSRRGVVRVASSIALA